jgi:intein/homing endonuclease
MDSWLPAKELVAGRDYIYLSECSLSAHWEGEGKRGEGYLLGLLTGDGTMKKNKTVLSVWSKGNPGYQGILDAVLEATRDMPARSDFQGWTYIFDRQEYRLSLGHIDGLCDKFNLSRDKQISPKIEKASLEFYQGFLSGFFDADGSVQGTQKKGVSIRLGQADLSRLEAVQRMLLRMNIISTIYKNRKEAGKSLLPDGKGREKLYPTKPMHELVISGESMATFNKLIGFSDTYKQELLDNKLASYKRNLNKDKYFAKFTELTPDGKEDVYDTTVQEMHCFDGNGLILHNCSEQSLESYELCCVSADTKILTKQGYVSISRVIDIPIEIWNGQEWSQVTPFVAGHDKNLYRVHLSDGSYLDVTDNHKWSAKLRTQRQFGRLETTNLEVGMQLEQTEIKPRTMDNNIQLGRYSYAWGFFAGDGYLDNNKIMLTLHGETDYKTSDYFEDIGAKLYKEQQPEEYSEPFRRVNLTCLPARKVSLKLARQLNDKDQGIPQFFFTMNDEDTLNFIAGWIDSDGSVCHQTNTDNYRIFGTEAKMRDMQLLLRRVGVNHASVYKMAEAGEQLVINGKSVIRNHDLWVCYIPSYECTRLADHCIIKKVIRIGDRYRINNAHPNGAKIDKARNQYVESIEKLDGKHTVYCFTEPKRHMGVFGNCLTYQCLVETFPARHDTLEEYQRTLKFAYLYAKTVTLLPTHNERTNAVMLRNRRIGTSQSGIAQALVKRGAREHFRWCDEGYRYLRSLDRIYSRWLCIPESIKVTSVKPSGTVSLLPGSTPGVHFPYAEYYWRTIRMDSGSELVSALRKAGYRIEDGEGHNTVVVYFPVHEADFHRSRDQISMWEQLEIVAQMQHWWADNQVSVTVTFNQDEAKEIERALELYETRLKSVSFLPLKDHGYKHAPYQPMTEQEYKAAVKSLKAIRLTKITETQGFEHKYCDSDVCEIPASKG